MVADSDLVGTGSGNRTCDLVGPTRLGVIRRQRADSINARRSDSRTRRAIRTFDGVGTARVGKCINFSENGSSEYSKGESVLHS